MVRTSRVLLVVALLVGPAAHVSAQEPGGAVSYYHDVRPIFQERCQGCHQPARPEGQLDVTRHEGLLAKGRDGDPFVAPREPDESPLLWEVTPEGSRPPKMPKDGEPLSTSEVERIRRWIAEGAVDDSPESSRARFTADEPPVYSSPPVITALEFSPDGTILAVSGYHEVLLHHPDGSGLVGRLVGLSERIESLAFSPGGKRLAVTGGSPALMGEIQIWDVESRKLELSRSMTYDTVRGASWSPDGSRVAFGCSDNSLRALEASTGKQVLFQGAHEDWVLDTVFSKDGSHLVSVSRDGSMKLTAVETEQFIDNITSITPGALKGGLLAVDRHPQKDELLAAGSDGVPKIYQMFRTQDRKIGDDFNLLRAFEPMPGRVFAASFSPDGARLVAGSSLDGSGEVRVYTVDDGGLLWTTRLPTGVYAVAFRPDGATLAAGGFDGLVRLLDAADGSILKEFLPVDLQARSVARESDREARHGPAPVDSTEGGLPAGMQILELEVFPPSVELSGRFSYRQLLVTGRLEGGGAVDLTRIAAKAADPDIVEVSASGLVRARADGEGRIRVVARGLEAHVPVKVSGVQEERVASFVVDGMPILSRLGCNAGTCHGSAKGKNGFKLSLRGYDAVFDHRALTDDLEGRRFNRAAPDRSLFLLKPSGGVPHVGGVLTRPGEPYYEILRSWITGGVTLDLESPRVERLELYPKAPVVPLPGLSQQVAVLATYTDGTVRDVTREAFVETNDIEVTRVDRRGTIAALRRGEAAVLARYEGRYAATPLLVMGDRTGFEWTDPPEYNYIDTLVYDKLRRVKTLPSGDSTDAEFLRRIYLDLTGVPPSPRDVRVFLLDARDSRTKRREVVDRLIGSAAFVEHWTNKWADLLQVNRKYLGEEGARVFRDWIRRSMASNLPYDQFCRSLLDSSGSTMENPPTAYYKILREPEQVMENTTQLFLGVRFNCNKCHDHPFERWTQRNYWELSAFFARVGRANAPGSPLMPAKGGNQPGDKPVSFEELISDVESGEIESPSGGGVVQAAFPFDHEGHVPEDATRRGRLTRWLVARENPYFASSFVNRIWSYLLGRGIIEPVDDIRAGNPPTNPELLDRLTEDFISSGYDVRHLLRTILTSRVYGLSIRTNPWNEDDDVDYSHARARRLPAETLYNAIHRATGSEIRVPGVRPGTLASELLDPDVEADDGFLALFGRPPRESACECERSSGLSLGQAMSLVNGPTVAEAIREPRNAIAELVAVERSPSSILEELFLSVLCRLPTEAERTELTRELDPGDPRAADALEPADRADLAQRLADWEKAQSAASWIVLGEPVATSSAGGATLTRLEDGSFLLSGESPEKDTYQLSVRTDLTGITGLRLEALVDPSLPAQGPGRADNGNFVLSELGLTAAPATAQDSAEETVVTLQNASADFSQEGYVVGAATDGKPETGWAVSPQLGRRHEAVVETREDVGFAGGTILKLTLQQQFGGRHTLGRFRVSVTRSPRPVRVSALPEEIVHALAVDPDHRTPEQRAAIHRHYLAGDPRMADRIRLAAAQDLAWALINSPAFLFNR